MIAMTNEGEASLTLQCEIDLVGSVLGTFYILLQMVRTGRTADNSSGWMVVMDVTSY